MWLVPKFKLLSYSSWLIYPALKVIPTESMCKTLQIENFLTRQHQIVYNPKEVSVTGSWMRWSASGWVETEESGKASESVCSLDGLTQYVDLSFFFILDLKKNENIIILLSALLSETCTQQSQLTNFWWTFHLQVLGPRQPALCEEITLEKDLSHYLLPATCPNISELHLNKVSAQGCKAGDELVLDSWEQSQLLRQSYPPHRHSESLLILVKTD